ncbi:T9SS type A sorting domain-containing protein [bacterium]|nr:T9SS type A sorting domain-containing protein [bacterium]
MTRVFILFLILLSIASTLPAQPPDVLWTTIVDDPDGSQRFESVVHASDGSIFAWGRDYVGTIDPGYLFKFDGNGDLLWSRTYDSLPLVLQGGTIISDGADGVYVCGEAWGPDIKLAHLDANGDAIWTSVDPNYDLSAKVETMLQLANGGFAVACASDSGFAGPDGVSLSIFTPDGNYQHTTMYDFGTRNLDVNSIIQLQDETLVIGGANGHDDEAFVMRVEPDGTLLWLNTWYSWQYPEINDLVALPDGNFAFCGHYDDSWVGVLTPDGEIVWEQFGTFTGTSVAASPAGGLIFTLSSTIRHTDVHGNLLWQESVEGLPYSSGFYSVCVTEEAGIIVAGGCGLDDLLIVSRLEDETIPQISLTLYPQSSTVIPASGGTLAFDAQVELNYPDPIICHGWTRVRLPNGESVGPLFHSPLNLHPGESWFAGGSVTVPAYAPEGAYQLVGILGFYPNHPLIVDELPFTKQAGWDVTLPMGPDDFSGSSPRNEQPLGNPSQGDLEVLPDTPVLGELYPNPTNGRSSLTVSLPQAGELRAELYDVTGRFVGTVFDGSVAAGNLVIAVETDGLASGTYLLRVSMPGQLDQTRRLVLLK